MILMATAGKEPNTGAKNTRKAAVILRRILPMIKKFYDTITIHYYKQLFVRQTLC